MSLIKTIDHNPGFEPVQSKPEAERLMLERLMGHAPEPLDGQTVRHVFERLIDECRRLEQHHTQK